ncbi:MAG TPA: hypothetical protein VGR07_20670, partial [Thermoanaerobaculia bacterium]|nr:hypothetical protein [Thermoanaerobaculia bacterium]
MTRRRPPVRLWLALGALAAVAGVLVVVTPRLAVDPEQEAAARCANGFRLTAGQWVLGRLARGSIHVYRIARERGEVLDAVVEQRGVDVAVALRTPSVSELMEVNSPNGRTGPETVFAVASDSTDYCLE